MLCGLELQRQRTYYSVLRTSRGAITAQPAPDDSPDKLPVVELRPFVSCVWERGKSYSNGFPDLPAALTATAPPLRRPDPESEPPRLPPAPVDLMVGSGGSPVRFETPRWRRSHTQPGPSWFTPEISPEPRTLGVTGRRLQGGCVTDLKALYSRGGLVRKAAADAGVVRKGKPHMTPLSLHRVDLHPDGSANTGRRLDAAIARRWRQFDSFGARCLTRGEMSLRRGKLANKKHYGRWLPQDGPRESLEGAMLTFGGSEEGEEEKRS